MRILEVTDFYYPWIAGPAPFIRNLATGLSQRGHDVTIACPSPTGRPFEDRSPPRQHRVRTFPIPFGYKLRAGFPVLDLTRLVRSSRPDVVHIHHPFPISLAGLAAAKAAHIPVVATNHTIPECTLYGLQGNPAYGIALSALAAEIRFVLSACDVVATPTETAAGMLKSLGFRKEVLAISNGVDTDRFHPPDGFGSPSSTSLATILYTGRLDDDKDMDTLIHALPEILKRVKATVRVGGEGTDRARLERKVREMGLAGSVQFTGYVSDSELPRVYQQASVYCIPSRVELQSISTLEAMASGLPIVAVEAGALPELVKAGINGALVPPGDSQAFAEAVANILETPTLARGYGEASRQISQGHSIGAMISQYERLFVDVSAKAAARTVYGATG